MQINLQGRRDFEDGGSRFLRNLGIYLPKYYKTAVGTAHVKPSAVTTMHLLCNYG
jgi:hypothetical protein